MVTIADVMADASLVHQKKIKNGHRCWLCHRLRPRRHILLGSSGPDRFMLMGRGYNGNPKGTPWPRAECRTDREACEWYASLWRQVHVAIADYERDRKEIDDDAE